MLLQLVQACAFVAEWPFCVSFIVHLYRCCNAAVTAAVRVNRRANAGAKYCVLHAAVSRRSECSANGNAHDNG